LAKRTYGRDTGFYRLNQVLDFARFLGWDIPRFGPNIPEEFSEIPPEGVDHIFENQAKLIVDVAPVTRVQLENGKYCPVRMICGTTPAGDLVWRAHLLVDREGCPYVTRKGQHYKVKTKGTQIVCQSETLPYDEQYIIECFGGQEGVYPVPFLPEFFSDRPVAHFFSPEAGVIEVVTISEPEPIHVLATDIVPWYRLLEIDRAKALPLEDEYDFAEERHPLNWTAEESFSDEEEPGNPDLVNSLVSGWDHLSDGEQFDVEEDDHLDEDDHLEEGYGDYNGPEYDDPSESITELTNLIVSLSDVEQQNLQVAEDSLSKTNISNKKEAEELRKDPKEKERAETWLLSAVNRLQILANASAKVGALISLIQRHRDRQILVIQPRNKWASQLTETLNQRGFSAELLKRDDKTTLRRFYDGSVQLLVVSSPDEGLFIDDLVIISVSSFDSPAWLELLTTTQTVYSISISQLGYSDFNLISEHPNLMINMENYEGPVLDVLKLTGVAPKTKKTKNTKYMVKPSKGRSKKFASYDKALEFAKKQELQSLKCEIYPPDSKEAVYITGIGEIK